MSWNCLGVRLSEGPTAFNPKTLLEFQAVIGIYRGCGLTGAKEK